MEGQLKKSAPAARVELIDFWAEWCGPCKIMEPILDEITKAYHDKIIMTKLNVDEESNQETIKKYGIMSVPTYLFIKDGDVKDQLIGVNSKADMIGRIDELLMNE